MQQHKCIYCLKIKGEKDFNREHVVPKMMGTYINGFVLSDFHVCKDCNNYFSQQLENKIALDSYEAFLRMQYRDKPMSDGHKLSTNRIQLTGDEGIFKGLHFSAITDNNNPYRIRFDIEPMVGIIESIDNNEYKYFSLEELPEATDEVISKMKITAQPIINTGIDRDRLESVLIEKGYLLNQYTYSEKPVREVYKEPEFLTKINLKIDPIMRRVCAKTVFNYLCYSTNKTFVLDPKFDVIRNYIRFGTWSDQLWFRYSIGPVSTVEMPNNTAHSVGYMWHSENNHWILCGCLTWFGSLTYVFKLGDTDQKVQKINFLSPTRIACFNNVNRTIVEDTAVHIFKEREN